MVISEKNYSEIKKLLENGSEITVVWDCGNDSTIIDILVDDKEFYFTYDTVFSAMVDYFNLPNATGGYYISGNGSFELEDDNIYFIMDAFEHDPEDSFTLEEQLDIEEIPTKLHDIFSKMEVKREISVGYELQMQDEEYCKVYINDIINFGIRYTTEDFKFLDETTKEVFEFLKDYLENIEHLDEDTHWTECIFEVTINPEKTIEYNLQAYTIRESSLYYRELITHD